MDRLDNLRRAGASNILLRAYINSDAISDLIDGLPSAGHVKTNGGDMLEALWDGRLGDAWEAADTAEKAVLRDEFDNWELKLYTDAKLD